MCANSDMWQRADYLLGLLPGDADGAGWIAVFHGLLLESLLEHEIAEREARRTERHRAESGLSPDKRLSGFDFNAVPCVSKAQVMALAEGTEWLDRGANVLLFGPPGVGKSHLVCALGHALIDAGRRDQAETSALFELIAERYERKSLAVTANTPFSKWGEVFVDAAMTVAAVDRLVHHATILEMNVQSYRQRTAQAATPARRASKPPTAPAKD